MKIGNKNVSFQAHITKPGEPILFGLNIWDGYSECCGNEITVCEFGLGAFVFGMFVESL